MPEKKNGKITLGPLSIPVSILPRWAKTCGGIVALLLASFMGFIYAWNSGGKDLFHGEEHTHMAEALRHAWERDCEDPSERTDPEKCYHSMDMDDGEGEMRHHDGAKNDDCGAVLWKQTIKHPDTGILIETAVPRYILHPSRVAEQKMLDDAEFMLAGVVPVSRQSCPNGRCLSDPKQHRGRYNNWQEPYEGNNCLWLDVYWWDWDGCRGYDVYDACNFNAWVGWNWVCCAH